MFSEDQLHLARSTPCCEIAERYGAKLKREGPERVGPCPVCGGREDKFTIRVNKNIWYCRGVMAGGGPVDLEIHLGGGGFVTAMERLIGKSTERRQPTPDEIAARLAREAERNRAEAEEQARNASSAAKIIARLQPVAGTPGEAYLRDVRCIDVSHWAIRGALESVEALGWCERTFFRQPGHELHGQWLGAIVAILTDPVTGERTGGITRTFIHQGDKICRAMSLGGVGRLGIIRLSPDDEVGAGLHLAEAIETAMSAMVMGFCPLWATGSTSQMEDFPVLPGVECLTVIADNDIKDAVGKEAGQQAARAVCRRWAAAGREAVMKLSKKPGEDANDILKRRARV
jgi:hypothetical protein